MNTHTFVADNRCSKCGAFTRRYEDSLCRRCSTACAAPHAQKPVFVHVPGPQIGETNKRASLGLYAFFAAPWLALFAALWALFTR